MTKVPITKKMEIIMTNQVCLISQMNINYKENSGKKSFSCQTKASILYPNVGNIIIVPNRTKNGDYYENQSLTYFMDKL